MKKIIGLLFLCSVAQSHDLILKNLPTQSPISLQTLTHQWNDLYKSQQQPLISAEQALSILIEHQDVVMLKFAADWCPPCKKWAPIVHAVAQENKTMFIDGMTINITVVEINIDKHKTIMNKYNIKNIPTAIYFANGKEVGRSTGALTKQETYTKIKNAATVAAKNNK